MLTAVAETFDFLAANPDGGIRYPTRNARLALIRMMPVSGFNQYLVFYRIEADIVRILYVVHGARHLPRLFKENQRQ